MTPRFPGASAPCWGLACLSGLQPQRLRFGPALLIHWLAVTAWLGPLQGTSRRLTASTVDADDRQGRSAPGLANGHD